MNAKVAILFAVTAFFASASGAVTVRVPTDDNGLDTLACPNCWGSPPAYGKSEQ